MNTPKQPIPAPSSEGQTNIHAAPSRRKSGATRMPSQSFPKGDKPKAFLLKWNNVHALATDERYTWHECWGTLYPNGRVTLDYGKSAYESMGELRAHIAQTGVYVFQWLENTHLTLALPEGTTLPANHCPVCGGRTPDSPPSITTTDKWCICKVSHD